MTTEGEWLNIFPDELQLGDELGEHGALVIRRCSAGEMTWTLVFSTDPPHPMREPTMEYANCVVYDLWPARAPLRVFRRPR